MLQFKSNHVIKMLTNSFYTHELLDPIIISHKLLHELPISSRIAT